jgi:hypothetical protein
MSALHSYQGISQEVKPLRFLQCSACLSLEDTMNGFIRISGEVQHDDPCRFIAFRCL